MRFWTVATIRRGVCYGHGDYADEIVIEKRGTCYGAGGQFPPLFLTKEDAQRWIDNTRHYAECEPVEMCVAV